MTTIPPPLNPSRRRLMGPGPSNVLPEIVAAMEKPLIGHLDPEFHALMAEVVDMLKLVYRNDGGLTFPLSGTGMAGLEAGVAALVQPGDSAVVGVAGFFGRRMADLLRRRGAAVTEVHAEPGQAVPNQKLLEALEAAPSSAVVAVVHAETSTGVRHDVAELGQALRGGESFLLVDCVTSLGGIEVEAGAWGIDYCFSCTQKCLGAPPGMSPVSLSDRALERASSRSAWVPFYFDLDLLAGYWRERPPKYHHTVPVLQIYALHEALRLILEEGLEARWSRHSDAGHYLREQLRDRGLDLLAEPESQLPQLTAVLVPDGIDGTLVRHRLATEFGIEVGGPLDATGPRIWRIGTMGANACHESIDELLRALDEVFTNI